MDSGGVEQIINYLSLSYAFSLAALPDLM